MTGRHRSEPSGAAAGEGAAPAPQPAATPAGVPTGVVLVTRTGGFAGLKLTGQVDLDGLQGEELTAWRSALSEGLASVQPQGPAPDRFVYRVSNEPAGLDVTVGDHELPEHLRSLLDSAVRAPADPPGTPDQP